MSNNIHAGNRTDNSLTIDGTNFRTLGGLRSLKSANGNVKITSNRRMCLADSIDWKLTHIIPQSATPTIASNRPASLCGKLTFALKLYTLKKMH